MSRYIENLTRKVNMSPKNLQYDFPKNEGGGVKGILEFFRKSSILLALCVPKGRMASPKLMNFRKSSKRPLTPPPHFRKIILRFSRQNCDKSAYVQYGGAVVYFMILFPMGCM